MNLVNDQAAGSAEAMGGRARLGGRARQCPRPTTLAARLVSLGETRKHGMGLMRQTVLEPPGYTGIAVYRGTGIKYIMYSIKNEYRMVASIGWWITGIKDEITAALTC